MYLYGAAQLTQYNPSTVKTVNVHSVFLLFGNEKLKFYKIRLNAHLWISDVSIFP